MTRTTNKRISLLKQIAVLPLLAAAMFLFSSKTAIAQDKLVDAKAVIETPAKPKAPWMQVGLGQTPFTKEGVSPAVFAKYKAFEKKFENVKPKSDFPSIAEDEKDEMEAIFKKMSREQQKDCQVYFLPPLGPSKAEHPKQADLNRWAKSKLYGVLIDGEKIQNEELANYSPADFSSFGVGLKLKEEFRKKFGYTYEVLLTSNEAFRKYNAARRANKRFEMVISFSRRDEKIKEFQTIK